MFSRNPKTIPKISLLKTPWAVEIQHIRTLIVPLFPWSPDQWRPDVCDSWKIWGVKRVYSQLVWMLKNGCIYWSWIRCTCLSIVYISILHIFKYASYMTKHLLSKNLDSYLLKENISLKLLYNQWPIEKTKPWNRNGFHRSRWIICCGRVPARLTASNVAN